MKPPVSYNGVIRFDPANAPRGERLLRWGQGGWHVGYVDDHGTWRSALGRPKLPPTAWTLMPPAPGPGEG